MIRVKLTNFRWHIDATLDFNSGHFTLLSGPSGIGKSTFFEAILWVLYNHTDYVHNHSHPEKTTEAILEIGHRIITRSNNPSFLIFREEEKEWRDSEAQREINVNFGSFTIFQLLNYVAQNERHIFLKLSLQERLDILINLLFKGTNPAQTLNDLDSKIRETHQRFLIIHGTYEQLSLNFKNLTQSSDVNAQFALNEEVIKEMQDQIQKLKNSLLTLRTQRDEVLKYRAEKECYERMIIDLSNQINNLTTLSLEILQYHEDLVVFGDIIKMRTAAMDKIVRDGLPTIPPPYFSAEEVTQAISQFRKHSEMSIKTLSCGIKYDPDIIANEKRNLLLSIEHQGLFPIVETYYRLKKQYDELEKVIDETITVEYLRELEAKIHTMEMNRDVLECPQCHILLRHISIGLVLSQEEKFDPVIYETTVRELTRARINLENAAKMNMLAQQINSIDVPEIPVGARKGDIKGFTSKYEQLSKIIYEPLPSVDPNLMQRSHTWHQLSEQKTAAEQKVAEAKKALQNPGNSFQLPIQIYTKEKIDILRSEVVLRKNLMMQRDNLQAKLDALKVPSVILEDLDIQIETESQTLQTVDDNIRKSQISSFALSQYHQLMTVRNEVVEVQQRLNDWQELRSRAENLKKEKVKNVINQINKILPILASQIFTDSIHLHLSNILELHVDYKGGSFTDMTIMSGGERDRINILLAATFHKLFDAPLLILDESLSNIDPPIKHKVLTMLHEHLKGKTIIMTCHETDGCYYDSVVNL